MIYELKFAVEHVYGHHKNVGLPIDPATAKRGESIYAFIIRAIINEHRDAWKIELKQCKKKNKSFSENNLQGHSHQHFPYPHSEHPFGPVTLRSLNNSQI